MSSWLIRLRDVIWSAVISVVLTVVAVLVALISPSSVGLVVALSGASIALALLSRNSR
jgi:drug/metabolite transporter superfamily protein YnfA